MNVVIGIVVVLLFFALIAAAASVRVLREYERGVIFRLGRLIATKGPGLILLIPFIDRMVKVELRTVTLSVPPQEVITRDNVPCRVNAVAYFRVVDQNRAVVEVENYLVATSQISQTALRSVLGKAELDQLLADRERLNWHYVPRGREGVPFKAMPAPARMRNARLCIFGLLLRDNCSNRHSLRICSFFFAGCICAQRG